MTQATWKKTLRQEPTRIYDLKLLVSGIHDHSDYGRSNKPMIPLWTRIQRFIYFDHPKGTHPTLRFMWQASCLLLGLCAMIKIWLVNLVNTWPRCFYFLFLTWLKGVSEEKCTGILPTGVKPVTLRLLNVVQIFTATVLAQLVEHVTAKRKVAGSIPGTGPILRVLKETEKWRYFLCTASR